MYHPIINPQSNVCNFHHDDCVMSHVCITSNCNSALIHIVRSTGCNCSWWTEEWSLYNFHSVACFYLFIVDTGLEYCHYFFFLILFVIWKYHNGHVFTRNAAQRRPNLWMLKVNIFIYVCSTTPWWFPQNGNHRRWDTERKSTILSIYSLYCGFYFVSVGPP